MIMIEAAKRRMADDRLAAFCLLASITAIRCDRISSRPAAISFNAFQNSSSRLTLVLWPAMTAWGDFTCAGLAYSWSPPPL